MPQFKRVTATSVYGAHGGRQDEQRLPCDRCGGDMTIRSRDRLGHRVCLECRRDTWYMEKIGLIK